MRMRGTMMYEELVKDLRFCASTRYSCVDCVHNIEPCCENILLTRAADAIEELQKEHNILKATAEDWRDAYHHWFENYQKDVPKWIPMTEQLPEKDGAYLVCYGNGLITTDTFMTFEDGRTKWYDSGYDIGGVTHWMPLPEPPKEKTE